MTRIGPLDIWYYICSHLLQFLAKPFTSLLLPILCFSTKIFHIRLQEHYTYHCYQYQTILRWASKYVLKYKGTRFYFFIFHFYFSFLLFIFLLSVLSFTFCLSSFYLFVFPFYWKLLHLIIRIILYFSVNFVVKLSYHLSTPFIKINLREGAERFSVLVLGHLVRFRKVDGTNNVSTAICFRFRFISLRTLSSLLPNAIGRLWHS